VRLDFIITTVSASKESDWTRWTEGDKELSYCKMDVNIRTERFVIWDQGKPYLQISIFYLVTTIASFLIPLSRASLDEQDFLASISQAMQNLK
jgi:hypothetical protein